MDSLFWLIVIIFGVISIPATQFLTANWSGNFMDSSWYGKVLGFILGCVLIGWLAWPLDFAAVWMETHQNKNPPFDLDLRLKGVLIMICWMIFTLQLFYRLGFKAATEKKKY
jgi:hypothetical protein